MKISIARKQASGAANAFTIFQPDVGTALVADSSTDTATFTSSDGTVTITGNSVTDTLDLTASAGDVVGPASAVDMAIARYDLTTGKIIQDSDVIVQDDGDIIPVNNLTQDLGHTTAKWRRCNAQLGHFMGGSGTMTFPGMSTHGGIVGGTFSGAGTLNMRLNGGSFPAIASIGNVAAKGSFGIATMEAISGGSIAFGSAYSYNTGVALVTSSGFSSFCAGYAYGSGTSTLQSSGPGSLAFGYANGRSSGGISTVSSSGSGSFASGFATSNNSSTTIIEATGAGSFAQGNVSASSGVLVSSIRATGPGSFAQGSSVLTDVGTPVTTSILSSGKGSFAQGYAKHNLIQATGINSAQFGVGTNATNDSLQVGDGIRFDASGLINMFKEMTTPSTPSANAHKIYFSNAAPLDNLRILDDAGNVRIVPDVGTQQVYTPTNVTTDRSYDANATTTAELADVLGSLIADLQVSGIIA